MTAAMAPMLAVVLIAAPGLNPVLGELVAWGVLCASPALTSAPASLVASVVALGRGWVTPDDGGGGGRFDGVPLGSTPPDSHEYTLAG
jgi:hypothetical protein